MCWRGQAKLFLYCELHIYLSHNNSADLKLQQIDGVISHIDVAGLFLCLFFFSLFFILLFRSVSPVCLTCPAPFCAAPVYLSRCKFFIFAGLNLVQFEFTFSKESRRISNIPLFSHIFHFLLFSTSQGARWRTGGRRDQSRLAVVLGHVELWSTNGFSRCQMQRRVQELHDG